MATLVKFVKDITPDFKGEVTAVFPQLNYNKILYGNVMKNCYTHIGQHNGMHIDWMIECTTSATPNEYADLKKELESLGYDLKVCD